MTRFPLRKQVERFGCIILSGRHNFSRGHWLKFSSKLWKVVCKNALFFFIIWFCYNYVAMYAGMFSVVVDCINILKSGLSVERIWTLNFSQNICAIFHYCTLLLRIHLGVCDSAKLSEPCWPTVCSKKDKIGMQNIQQYPGPRLKNLLNLLLPWLHL